HFRFWDKAHKPKTFEAKGRGGVSPMAGAFAAGIMRHLPAMVAFTAGSSVSYFRLQPHYWSASYTWFGECDRKASLRICPTVEFGGADVRKQFNLEFRAA